MFYPWFGKLGSHMPWGGKTKRWNRNNTAIYSIKTLKYMQLNAKKKSNIKIGRRSIQTFFSPKKLFRWPADTQKWSSISLIIRGLQIQITINYHLISVRMAVIKKIRNNCCWGWGEKRMLWYAIGFCCSITKACPTLCDPMDCSTPGFPV